jgi:hypothetical protein
MECGLMITNKDMEYKIIYLIKKNMKAIVII